MPAAGLSVSVYDSAFSLCGVWNSLHAVSNDFFMLIHLTFNLKYSMHCNKSLLLCVCAYWLLYLLFVFANRFVGVLITSILLRWCVLMCRPVNSITYLYLLLFSYRAEKTEVLSDDLLQVTTSFHTLALFALDVICCLLENATSVLYERFIEAFYIRTVCQVGFVSWHCKIFFFLFSQEQKQRECQVKYTLLKI